MATWDDHHWDAIDRAVQFWEAAWRSGDNNDLRRLVPPAGDPHRRGVLVTLIKVDQERQWLRGHRLWLEDYLREWPELVEQTSAMGDLLAAECRIRRESGQEPTVDELRRRFPKLPESILQDACRDNPTESPPGKQSPTVPHALIDLTLSEIATRRGLRQSPVLRPGTYLGRYRVTSVLGRGGMGTVYLAQDEQLQRAVAIKVPHADFFASDEEISRLLNEARTVATLKHPGIVAVYDVGTLDDGTRFFVMEHVEGHSLADLISDSRVSQVMAIEFALRLAEILEFAHAQGFIHRDIKPANILVQNDGRPRLADFGLAVHDNARRLNEVEFAGTLPYMAPEQLQTPGANLDERTDIWALGVVLVEMLTGQRPFSGDSREKLTTAILNGEPQGCSGKNRLRSRDLEAVCRRCLAKTPVARYANASALAADLRNLRQPKRSSRKPVTMAALLCLPVVLLATFWYRSGFVAEGLPLTPRQTLSGARERQPSRSVPLTRHVANGGGREQGERTVKTAKSLAQQSMRIAVDDSTGRVNVAAAKTGATAFADSTAAYEDQIGWAVNAIDDDPVSAWHGHDGQAGWLRVDFDRPWLVDMVEIQWGAHRHEFSIEASVDLIHWETVLDRETARLVELPDGPVPERYRIAPVIARSIRVMIAGTNAPAAHNFQASICDLRVWCSAGVPAVQILPGTPSYSILAVSPDGETLFVPTKEGVVSALDTATLEIRGSLQTDFDPLGVAVSPDGSVGYATNTVNGYFATRFDPRTMEHLGNVRTGVDSAGVVFSPTGDRVYMINHYSPFITVIDPQTNEMLGSITGIETGGGDLVLAPDGRLLYATGRQGELYRATTTTDAVATRLDLASGSSMPERLLISRDGGRLFVAGCEGQSVHVISTAMDREIGRVACGGWVSSLALTADNRLLLVAVTSTDRLLVLDADSLETIDSLHVPGRPRGVVASRDNQRAFVTLIDSKAVVAIDLGRYIP